MPRRLQTFATNAIFWDTTPLSPTVDTILFQYQLQTDPTLYPCKAQV
jgi:hypothetical protein